MNNIPELIINHLKNDVIKELIEELHDPTNERYILEINEVVDKYFKDNKVILEEDIEDEEVLISISHIPRDKFTYTEHTCIARVWNRGDPGQCSKKKCEGKDALCTAHSNQFKKHGYLCLGTINEEPKKEYIHYNGNLLIPKRVSC